MDHFFLKTGRQQYEKVALKDILYIEGSKGYSKLVTVKRTYTVLLSLRNWVESLPKGRFLKIHQSYVVAVERINRIDWDLVWLHDTSLPLSRMLRKNLLESIHIVQPVYSQLSQVVKHDHEFEMTE